MNDDPGRELASEAAVMDFGMTLDEAVSSMERMAQALIYSPQEELKWRMNEWVKGRHPGPPVNWRGL